MGEQQSLDFQARRPYRRTDPASSRMAAERAVASGRVAGLRVRLLARIEQYPGSTAERLAALVGAPVYEVRKRTADLRTRKEAYSRLHENECVLRWYPGPDPIESAP